LNEIKLIDGHLLKQGDHADSLLFDAMLIINPELSGHIKWQKQAHQFVGLYGRKKLKTEIESVHQKLFNEPVHKRFRERIMNFFS
jgi:hypothetical protein